MLHPKRAFLLAFALAAQGLGLIDDAGLRATVIAALTPVLAELRYRLAKLSPQ